MKPWTAAVVLACCTLIHPAYTGRTLLISLDGFRWDYLTKTDTPNFDKMIDNGVQVRQVTNAFATMTMPNHYTLVTGLYEEDHGIINNRFYDPAYNDTYSYGTESKWYNLTEPIWIAAEREGMKSGAFMWVGNEAEYNGVSLSKVTPFASNTKLRSAIDTVAGWFIDDGVQLACLYTDQPDKLGHSDGPNSEGLKAKLRDIDSDLGYLMKKFEDANIAEEVNILIASDHGMTEVAASRTILMTDYLDMDTEVEWSYLHSIGLIIPNPGLKQQVYDKLDGVNEHFTVYKKEDLPDDLHYKNNDRIPEIVVVVEKGWILKSSDYNFDLEGQHGYDNKEEDMKTTFIAYGPDFKCGHKQDAMNSVDLYPLMCEVLGLENCHNSSGLFNHTADLLSAEVCHYKPSASSTTPSASSTTPSASSTTPSTASITAASPLTIVLLSMASLSSLI